MDQGRSFSHLATAELTDQGLRRSRNEDAIIRIPDAGVFCVADGIGGSSCGDEASQLTVSILREEFSAARYHTRAADFEFRKNLVREAMNKASQAIRALCAMRGVASSGTTAVTIVFDKQNPSRAAVLHAGDSRAYRMRGGRIDRLTKDHTLAVEQPFPDKDAWTFGMRTIVTRAVGVRPFVDLDESEVEVQLGDVFLLCTDGLTRMLADQEIADIVRQNSATDLNETVRRLVDEANEAGGKDNITVLLVRVDDHSAPVAPKTAPWRNSAFNRLINLIPRLLFGRPRQPGGRPVR